MSKDLFDAAFAAMLKTHSPYSQFPVEQPFAQATDASSPAATSRLFLIRKGGVPKRRRSRTSSWVVAASLPKSPLLLKRKRNARPAAAAANACAEFAGPEALLHLCDNDGIVET